MEREKNQKKTEEEKGKRAAHRDRETESRVYRSLVYIGVYFFAGYRPRFILAPSDTKKAGTI